MVPLYQSLLKVYLGSATDSGSVWFPLYQSLLRFT